MICSWYLGVLNGSPMVDFGADLISKICSPDNARLRVAQGVGLSPYNNYYEASNKGDDKQMHLFKCNQPTIVLREAVNKSILLGKFNCYHLVSPNLADILRSIMEHAPHEVKKIGKYSKRMANKLIKSDIKTIIDAEKMMCKGCEYKPT
jgi:hypothetical protein